MLVVQDHILRSTNLEGQNDEPWRFEWFYKGEGEGRNKENICLHFWLADRVEGDAIYCVKVQEEPGGRRQFSLGLTEFEDYLLKDV